MDSKVHKFSEGVDISHLPERFNDPFDYVPHPLVKCAAGQLQEYLDAHYAMNEGKMFGVLVVKDKDGEVGFLAAYSGIFGDNVDSYFVPPIFNLLDKNEFYLKDEARLNSINAEIKQLEGCRDAVKSDGEYVELQKRCNAEIDDYKRFCSEEKKRRAKLRLEGVEVDVKESQFQKAQLKRLKKEAENKYIPFISQIANYDTKINELKEERANFSAKVQDKIFKKFIVKNYLGEEEDLVDIFSRTVQKTPPGGSGECAAPKLLHYAFCNGLTPVCMGEFWWGTFEHTEIRCPGVFYPSCTGKCKPILGFMLRGMQIEHKSKSETEYEILYEDDYLIIVDKPSGLLSVPGVDSEVLSMQELLEQKIGEVYAVHRLDMDTSGVIVYAKTKDVQRELQSMFRNGDIKKKYLAVVDGKVGGNEGEIELPLAPDYINRPRQMVSHSEGKYSLTHYKVIKRNDKLTLLEFSPITGRTHQLRIHSAHEKGLNCPIVGDRLYGTNNGARLHLHAYKLSFVHPVTKAKINVEANIPQEFNLK